MVLRGIAPRRVLHILVVLAFIAGAGLLWPDSASRPRIAAADNTVTVELAESGSTAGIAFEPAGLSLDPPACSSTSGFGPGQVCTDILTIENHGIAFNYSIAAWVDTNGVDDGPEGPTGDALVACFNLHLTTDLADGQAVGDLSSQGPLGPFTLAAGGATAWRLDASVDDVNDCQGAQASVFVWVTTQGIASSEPEETQEPDPTSEPTEEPVAPLPTQPVEPLATAANAASTPVAASTPAALIPPPPAPSEPQDASAPQASSQTPATPTPAITQTPSPTATATPQSTATASATPTPSPTPTPSSTPPPGPPRAHENRPELISEVLDLTQVRTDLAAIGTNLLFATVLLLLILLDATIFNKVVEENAGDIHEAVAKLMPPLTAIRSATIGIVHGLPQGPLRALPHWPLTLLVTAVIYSSLDPSFGLNQTSLVLLGGIIATLAAATLAYDGSKVLFARRAMGMEMVMRFVPAALFIACASVLISRVTGIHPGVIYGFVAATKALSALVPNRQQQGLLVFVPMVVMFLVSVCSWVVLSLVRPAAIDGSAPAAFIEAVTAAVFISGLQSVFFNLTPLKFVDGDQLWQWNRVAWFAIALPTAFLLFHVILNNQGEFAAAVSTTSIQTLAIICLGLWVVTMTLWFYFRLRTSKSAE